MLLAFAILATAWICIAQPARAAEMESTPNSADHQILVMIHMAPPHYQPNSGYGGSYGGTMSNAARRRIARRIARRHGLDLVEGWPMPLLAVDCYVMTVPPSRDIAKIVSEISDEPGVAWSQPMNSFVIGAAASAFGSAAGDPLLPVQPTAIAWRLTDLQRVATGRNIKVAVIDSKIETGHPDLANQFSIARDFVGGPASGAESHGTRVAGIIGAKAGNGIGIAGVAPNAKVMALRACIEERKGKDSGKTFCRSIALARALQFAIQNNADVINLSLAGPYDQVLASLIERAVARNIAVVAAFDRDLPHGGFPALQRGVIAVTDETVQSLPDGVYIAPGQDLPTTQVGGGWGLVSGSSYAVAQVSGLVALVAELEGRRSRVSLSRAPDGRVRACTTLLGTLPECDCSCKLGGQLSAVGPQ